MLTFVALLSTINMYAIVNTLWIKKIVLFNGRMTLVAFQMIQPKLYKHSQIKTHYDTLEVSSKATQDEIKSSYYKLSMLYHPDKNKTELAKRKFQNISEAYEVLSNHQARKRYDRSMMIIKQNVKRNEPKNTYTHASIYKSKIHPMNSKHFNYDLWVKEHYGRSFTRTQAEYIWLSQQEMNQKQDSTKKIGFLLYIVTFTITFIFMICGVHHDYDVPKDKKGKESKS